MSSDPARPVVLNHLAVLYARRARPDVWPNLAKAIAAGRVVISMHDGSEYMWKGQAYELVKAATRSGRAPVGGPYIGPRGGKWADPQHTIPWDEDKHGAAAQIPLPFDEPKKRTQSHFDEALEAAADQVRRDVAARSAYAGDHLAGELRAVADSIRRMAEQPLFTTSKEYVQEQEARAAVYERLADAKERDEREAASATPANVSSAHDATTVAPGETPRRVSKRSSRAAKIAETPSLFDFLFADERPPAPPAPDPVPVEPPAAPVPESVTMPAVAEYGAAPGATKGQRKKANARALELVREAQTRDLTPEELAEVARFSGDGGVGSSLNQYFTRPDHAAAIWKHLIKLSGGQVPARVLEPAVGGGVFCATAPTGSTLTGVEIDPKVAEVARTLHGARHNIVSSSFEEFALRNADPFDAVISNAPFCTRTGGVSRYHKPEMVNADQYFLDTALDQVKPGGVVAMIVHRGVMDSSSSHGFREKLLARAEVLDAVRLPQEAFKHSHTEVTTDVLFLRRRDPAVGAALEHGGEELSRAVGAWDEGFVAGGWYAAHPDRLLGTMVADWRDNLKGEGGAHACTGDAGAVAEAFDRFEGGSASPAAKSVKLEELERPELAQWRSSVDYGKASAEKLNPLPGATKVEAGITYILTGNPARWHRLDEVDDVAAVIGITPTPALDDARLVAAEIKRLKDAIDRNDFYSARAIRREVEPRVQSWVDEYGLPSEHKQLLELGRVQRDLMLLVGAVQPDGSLSDMVRRDPAAIQAGADVDGDDLAAVGRHVAAQNDGEVSLEDVRSLWNGAKDRTDEEILDALLAFDEFVLGAGGRVQHIEDAVTGDLWTKRSIIRSALAEAEKDSPRWKAYGRLETALTDRINQRWRSLDDVELDPRGGWIPLDVVSEFLELVELSRARSSFTTPNKVELQYEDGWFQCVVTRPSGTKEIDDGLVPGKVGGYTAKDNAERYRSWSGRREAFMAHMNRLPMRGKRLKEDAAEVLEQFAQWLRSSKHRAEIEELYNRTFHGEVAREFSTAPLEVQGVDKSIKVKPHIYSAVRWAAAAGKGIIALDVGLGKTWAGTILARYLRNMGKAKKPVLVVPKSVATNWQREIEKVTPGARVLVIGESSHVIQSGKKKGDSIARSDNDEAIAQKLALAQQNDYDLIIVTRPAFQKIPLRPDTEKELEDGEFFAQRAAKMKARLIELGREKEATRTDDDVDTSAVTDDKKAQKQYAQFQSSEAARKFQGEKAPIYWEDLGVDFLMADEAHSYKNLYAARKRGDKPIKFLGGSGLSKQSRDMQFKAAVVRQKTGDTGVYFLTATPTKNSPLEVYNMMAQIAPEEFEKRGITNAETFIDRYCETEERMILDSDSELVQATAVTGFKALTELHSVMDKYMLVRTAADVGLPIPAAKQHIELVDMTGQQIAEYARIREEALEAKGKNDPGALFRSLDAMKKVATDLELLYPGSLPGWHKKSPKYQKAVARIMEGVRERGGQIVFCDSNPSHERLKGMLVDAGMKPEEIGIINADVAKDSETRFDIGQAFNEGKLKVVIGNTATMGEGVNLQVRTTDIHHLDQPWDPGSMQQRNGRGVRQGNDAAEVNVWTYLSKRSFDGFRHGTLEGKRSWLARLRSGADRITNDAASDFGGGEEMLVMLADDPEKARAELAEKRAEKEAAWAARKRADSAATFGRYMTMLHRLDAMDPKSEAHAAQRLKLEVLERRLANDEYLPPAAKELVGKPGARAIVAPETGTVFQEGTELTKDTAWGPAKGYIMRVDAANQRVRIAWGGAATEDKWTPLAELEKVKATGRTDAAALRETIDELKERVARKQWANIGALVDWRPSLLDAHEDEIRDLVESAILAMPTDSYVSGRPSMVVVFDERQPGSAPTPIMTTEWERSRHLYRLALPFGADLGPVAAADLDGRGYGLYSATGRAFGMLFGDRGRAKLDAAVTRLKATRKREADEAAAAQAARTA